MGLVGRIHAGCNQRVRLSERIRTVFSLRCGRRRSRRWCIFRVGEGSASDNNLGKPNSSRRRHTGCIRPLPARRGANIRPISDSALNGEFSTSQAPRSLTGRLSPYPSLESSIAPASDAYCSISQSSTACIRSSIRTPIKTPIDLCFVILSAMTRPKVPPDQRQRTAQACESCKRRKQKASCFNLRWITQAANPTILILVFDMTRALKDLLSSLLRNTSTAMPYAPELM